MTSSDLRKLTASLRSWLLRGMSASVALLALVGLASCGGPSAGVVPDDSDHGVLVSSPGAMPGGVPATSGGTPPAPLSQTAGAAPTADVSGGDVGDVHVTGRTNLGGNVSAEFAERIRSAVEAYVSKSLPGTIVAQVRVSTEQSRFTPAVVTLDGAGGARKVIMTLAQQPTGWVVSSITPFLGGSR